MNKDLIQEFMNNPHEVHGFVDGLYTGFRERKGRDDIPEEYAGEDRWYWQGGYVTGTLLKYALFIIIGGKLI